MNFEFAEKINPHLEKLEFTKALKIAERELKKIPPSDFHAVLGQSLIELADGVASWIDDFYKKASKKFVVKALYFEMNEFDINTDDWYINGFAYEKDGGLDPDDMEWLVDFQTDARTETGNIVFDDYEKLQKAFANIQPATKKT